MKQKFSHNIILQLDNTIIISARNKWWKKDESFEDAVWKKESVR